MKTLGITFILATFVGMAVFGVEMGMIPDENGNMSGCPFATEQTSVCPMNTIEHIAQWQQAFLGMPIRANLLALAIIALLAVVIIPLVKPFFQLKKLTMLAARLLAYHKDNLVKVFDPLLVAFSDGILNPKIY